MAGKLYRRIQWFSGATLLGLVMVLVLFWYQGQWRQARLAPWQAKSPIADNSPSVSMQSVALPSPPAPLPPPVAKTPAPAASAPAGATPAKGSAAPAPAAKSVRAVDVKTLSGKDYARGQALLASVERGQGAGIELAWPAAAAQRAKLFDQLYDCLGIGLGRIHRQRLAPLVAGQQGYSGLARLIGGAMTPREKQLFARAPGPGQAVRLFPRYLDGRLFAGLQQLGVDLSRGDTVQGRYRLANGQLGVVDVRVGGRPVAGQLLLADLCR